MRRILPWLVMTTVLGGCFGLFRRDQDPDEVNEDTDRNACRTAETVLIDIKTQIYYEPDEGQDEPAPGALLALVNRATDEVLVTSTADNDGNVRLQDAPIITFEGSCWQKEDYEDRADYALEAEYGVQFHREPLDLDLGDPDDDEALSSGVLDLWRITVQ